MPNAGSLDDLLDFLAHASEKGLMPAATAQALAVASRKVFSVLTDEERGSLPVGDLDGVIKRFTNKRAKEFNPSSLKEYGRRVRRAVELYQQWLEGPADFSVKTRATAPARRKERFPRGEHSAPEREVQDEFFPRSTVNGGYQTAFPIRPGLVVTISNIPHDLTASEAERMAQFIRLLVPNAGANEVTGQAKL